MDRSTPEPGGRTMGVDRPKRALGTAYGDDGNGVVSGHPPAASGS